MLFHIPIFVIVLGMTEGGFLLLELLPALAVDVRQHSRSVARRRIVRHLLHSTAKAHSVAHKITAVIEIHAHRRIFFFDSCATVEISRLLLSEIEVTAFCIRSVSSLQAEEYLALRLPACLSNSAALICISVKAFCASCFVRSVFRSAFNCICCRNSLSCISSSALQFRSVTITLGSSRCASSISFLCCVNISCVVILRSVSKFRLHIFFQVFFYVQLVITASTSVWCDIGDIFTRIRPCGIVTLRTEQRQKFLTIFGAAHTLINHAHELELPTLASVRRVVFCVGHSARMPLLVFLKFRQPQFLTDFVVADAQLLNLFVRHMHLPPGFKIHTVDDTVRVDMLPVDVRADQNFAAFEVSGEPACRFVRCARVDVRGSMSAPFGKLCTM